MGIWLLIYGIANNHNDRYLDWFHNTHIDEKLARPGYDWAAHYQLANPVHDHQYIALFGSSSSRTFFDPSPKQLKPKQDALTREMIDYRLQPVSLICTAQWSNASDNHHAIQSNWIQLNHYAEDWDEQDVMAWCAQQFAPPLEKEFIVHQFLASAGAPRHLSIIEASELTESLQAPSGTPTEPTASRLLATRIEFQRPR